jgi:hypothetical protein
MKKFFILLMTGIAMYIPGPKVNAQIWTGSQPMYYNPSFAGSGDRPRLAYLTKYTFNSGPRDNYRLYNDLSGDFFISKISTGIGIKTDYDIQKNLVSSEWGNFEAYAAAIVIAPKISLKGRYTISPGFEINYNYLSQYQNINGVIYFRAPDYTIDVDRYYHFIGYKGSILFNSRKFYLGYTLNSYSRDPDYIYSQAQVNVDKKFWSDKQTVIYTTVQTGYSFQKDEKSKFSFTPQMVVGFRKTPWQSFSIRQLDLNLRYKKFLTGLSYRKEYTLASKDNLGIVIGVQTRNLRIALINSRRFNFWGGTSYYKNIYSSCLSIRYQFSNNDPEKKLNNFISQK